MAKYGRIICDPEEGKTLLGKKVLASQGYTNIENGIGVCILGKLKSVCGDYFCPFTVEVEDHATLEYTFIREVIEEAPTYRPFRNVDELIAEWEKRFGNSNRPKGTMPLVWIKPKNSGECSRGILMTEFWEDGVCITFGPQDKSTKWQELFDDFCFLDGSPLGVEVTE